MDIASVLSGEPRVFEFAVGYRVTNAIFDHLNGPHGPFATRLLMVSKSEIAVVDLQALETTWILERLWVDNPDAQVVEAREVLATPDASMLFFRNFNTSELTVVEVESGLSTRLRLHGIPTDVDLSPDGSTLLAVQRAESIVTRVDLAADLSRVVEVDGVRYFDPDGDGVPTAGELPHLVAEGPVGQAELYVTPDGRLSAVLYTNVDRAEEISLMRVDTMQLTNLGHLINKLVDYVVVSPVASTAMVVHRPDYASTDPDPVEREIDSLHGYTLVDLPTLATFQQVIEAPVGPLSFSSTGRFAILTVFNQALEVNELHVVDLLRLTLRMDTVPLEALPQFVGVLPFREIAYVAQEHAYGKITFVDMESMAKRAVTGYELNAD